MKTKTTYICSECGYKSPKWLGDVYKRQERAYIQKICGKVGRGDFAVNHKQRTRLFLSDTGYENALDSQEKGQIKILSLSLIHI